MARTPLVWVLGLVAAAATACSGSGASTSSGTADALTCAVSCRQSSGGPPVNDCRLVGGSETCVYRCTGDGECAQLAPFYQSCGGRGDDGTRFCTSGGPDLSCLQRPECRGNLLVNACRPLRGVSTCVRACGGGGDGGQGTCSPGMTCTGIADDGSRYCVRGEAPAADAGGPTDAVSGA